MSVMKQELLWKKRVIYEVGIAYLNYVWHPLQLKLSSVQFSYTLLLHCWKLHYKRATYMYIQISFYTKHWTKEKPQNTM